MRNLASAIFLILFVSASARAEAKKYPALNYDAKISIPLTVAAGGGALGLQVFQKDLLPSQCRWCATNAFDRSARDEFRWSSPHLATTFSEITTLGLAPLSAWAVEGLRYYQSKDLHSFVIDSLVIAEALSLSLCLNEGTKILAARERPTAHDLQSSQGSSFHPSVEDRTSFYSRHTNFAFTLAVASGTIASLRDYPEAPWVWGFGLGIATLTGYLRVASDSHYLSDTLMGAAAGSLVGFAVPYFLHHPEDDQKQTSIEFFALPTSDGITAGLKRSW